MTDLRNQHYYSEELKKQKEKSKSLLQDFEKAVFKRDNTVSVVKETSSKGHSPHKSVAKSVGKFTRQLDPAFIKEDDSSSKIITAKSIESHTKFLDFIRPYYNIR